MSTTSTIPGQLTASALRKLHQPADLRAIDAEIVRLRTTGLLPRDIAQLLNLNIAIVQVALTRSVLNGY